jgi:type I restriction enzyme S subunit
MNAERLLALYERVAEAPDAITRLRRFILDLAVRGKLVPQDPNDEPASELLKRIAKEKARLVKEGKAKRQDVLPEADLHQSPFELPARWAWGRFPELGTLGRGKSKHRPRNDPALFDGGEHLMIQTGDVARSQGVIETYTSKYNDFGLSQSFKWPKGTLCITIAANIADSGILSFDACFPDSVVGFVPSPMFENARYFEYFVRTAKANLLEFAPATAQKNINLEILTQVLIPLPPLAEQHRIVPKVDELMALCDQLEATRQEREARRDRLAAASLAHLNAPDPETFQSDARFTLNALPALTTRPNQIKQLRQTILNLAVRGKLVPQDPNDEPASKLLKQIAADKADRAISARDRRATNIRPLVGEELPFPIPSSWIWASFGDISISRDGERIPVSREERSQRAKVYDYYGASGVIDKIDGFLFDKSLLLIGEDGANLINRSTPIAFIARGNYWVNNHAHVLDGLSEGFLQYLELFINSIDLKPYVTGTAQPKMNQAKLNSIPIALPPLAEQHRIVAKVDELMVLCDRLETSLTTSNQTRTRLLEATLAEALAPASVSEMEAAE